MNALTLVIPGMLLGLGLVLIVSAFRPQHARLANAMETLAGSVGQASPQDVADGERLGAWLLARRPGLVSDEAIRCLELRGRSVTAHVTAKAFGSIFGFLAPLLLGMAAWLFFGLDPSLPLIGCLAGAAIGFFVPDIALRKEARNVTADATEALLTYFDLVTLERLANASATQALHSAAALSDVAIFSTIRGALDRARLQQRMPYAELKRVGRQLELPALADLADVMALDDTGASLSGTLRARVRELRDAHLTQMKVSASEVSEQMTVFMVIPSLVFALLFLAPPLLRLVIG